MVNVTYSGQANKHLVTFMVTISEDVAEDDGKLFSVYVEDV